MLNGENDNLIRVFEAAEGKWQGCDWTTRFGKHGIDLCGLKSSQARLMARATSGMESEDWRNASDWLSQVENDAQTAEREAVTAVEQAQSGDLVAARDRADHACSLERQYRQTAVWQPLHDLLQYLASRFGNAAGS